MTRTFQRWIAVGVVCGAVVRGHAQAPQDGAALIGTWTSPEPSARAATLTFRHGGIFEVEFLGDDGVEVSGRYQVVNNELRMTDEGGIAACLAPEYGPGRYSFRIRAGELALDAIKDECDGRVMLLERRAAPKRTWTKRR